MKLVVEPAPGVPSLTWRWDDETDILSGAFVPGGEGIGPTVAVELTDETGSIIVMDVVGGVVCGLDIVVWPDIVTEPRLAAPRDAIEGRLHVPPAIAEEPAVEIDSPIALRTGMDESVVHLRLGPLRAVTAVRVADHLLVEVDARQVLAGFWLTGVPPLPAAAEEPE